MQTVIDVVSEDKRSESQQLESDGKKIPKLILHTVKSG